MNVSPGAADDHRRARKHEAEAPGSAALAKIGVLRTAPHERNVHRLAFEDELLRRRELIGESIHRGYRLTPVIRREAP